MREVGLVRSAYHFGRPGESAVDQARYFVHVVNAKGGVHNSSTMPLVLDLEQTDSKTPAEVWAWVQAFMGELEKLTGKPGNIYVGFYFWTGQTGNPSKNLGADLWVAAYTPAPKVPAAWKDWTFWQYTDKENVPGISGGVDGGRPADYLCLNSNVYHAPPICMCKFALCFHSGIESCLACVSFHSTSATARQSDYFKGTEAQLQALCYA